MTHKHPATQFNVQEQLRRRPLERLMISNHAVGQVVHFLGYHALSAMIWPRFVAPYRWTLSRHAMPITGLPVEFEGYKILHVSDLHIGRTRVTFLQRVLRQAQEQRPNLVVVTGDFIHYTRRALPALPYVLPELRAPDGVIGIFGNHDYHEYSWRHIGERSAHRAIHKRLVKALEAQGITLLRNQSVAIRRAGAALYIVGIDELWVGHCDPAKAFAAVPANVPIICLQHNPDGYEYLKDYPWQWLLCGHTHGGQVNLPVVGPLYVPSVNRQWLRGVFPFPAPGGGTRYMHVSTGIGYTAPIRMRVKPEVTLFTLTRA